jgi:hypothetical protein
MIKKNSPTVMLDVYLKPSSILKVGLVTDDHALFVHDENGKSEKWIVSGTIRSLSRTDNGMIHAIVEDEDLDYQVQFIRHR